MSLVNFGLSEPVSKGQYPLSFVSDSLIANKPVSEIRIVDDLNPQAKYGIFQFEDVFDLFKDPSADKNEEVLIELLEYLVSKHVTHEQIKAIKSFILRRPLLRNSFISDNTKEFCIDFMRRMNIDKSAIAIKNPEMVAFSRSLVGANPYDSSKHRLIDGEYCLKPVINWIDQSSPETCFKLLPLEIVPDKYGNQRQVIVITGASGSHKTTLATNYLKIKSKMNPDTKMFLFSSKNVEDEPLFAGLKITQIDTSVESLATIVQAPIKGGRIDVRAASNESLYKIFPEGCFILFDDVESFSIPCRTAIRYIQDSVLMTGRARCINVVIINHLLKQGIDTKTQYNEATHLIFMHRGLSKDRIRQMIDGFTHYEYRTQIMRYMTLPGDYIGVTRVQPYCLFSQYFIKLITQ